jgi:hypothetical protein
MRQAAPDITATMILLPLPLALEPIKSNVSFLNAFKTSGSGK